MDAIFRLTLIEEAAQWVDTCKSNKDIVDRFIANVNEVSWLKEHRDFVEKHAYGLGERAFHWMWKLLVDEMPDRFSFMEIGVFKGQVPSAIRLIAERAGKDATIIGVTPLSREGGEYDSNSYPDDDYKQCIQDLHDHFDQPMPKLLVGESTELGIIKKVQSEPKFDIIYVDGGHDYVTVVNDILKYGPCVKPGGYLVMDDSACNMAPNWGFYQGILPVTHAVRTLIETDASWEHLFALMHLRVWRKVATTGKLIVEPIIKYDWKGTAEGNVAIRMKP